MCGEDIYMSLYTSNVHVPCIRGVKLKNGVSFCSFFALLYLNELPKPHDCLTELYNEEYWNLEMIIDVFTVMSRLLLIFCLSIIQLFRIPFIYKDSPILLLWSAGWGYKYLFLVVFNKYLLDIWSHWYLISS